MQWTFEKYKLREQPRKLHSDKERVDPLIELDVGQQRRMHEAYSEACLDRVPPQAVEKAPRLRAPSEDAQRRRIILQARDESECDLTILKDELAVMVSTSFDTGGVGLNEVEHFLVDVEWCSNELKSLLRQAMVAMRPLPDVIRKLQTALTRFPNVQETIIANAYRGNVEERETSEAR